MDSTFGEFHWFILKIQLASLRMQSRLCFFFMHMLISASIRPQFKTSLFGIIVRGQPERVVVHSAVLARSAATERIVLTVRRAVQTKLNQDYFLWLSGEAWGRTRLCFQIKTSDPDRVQYAVRQRFLLTLDASPGQRGLSLACARLGNPLPLLLQVPPGKV